MEQKLPIHKYSDNPMAPLFWTPMSLSPFFWGDDSMFASAQRNMNRLLNETLDNFKMAAPVLSRRIPAVDVSEDRKAFRVKLPVPGLEADDIDISADNGMLTISAEKTEKKNGNESSFSFTQSMSLPEGVNIDKADVSLANHMLSIEIPKSNGDAQNLSIREGGQKQQQKARQQNQQAQSQSQPSQQK